MFDFDALDDFVCALDCDSQHIPKGQHLVTEVDELVASDTGSTQRNESELLTAPSDVDIQQSPVSLSSDKIVDNDESSLLVELGKAPTVADLASSDEADTSLLQSFTVEREKKETKMPEEGAIVGDYYETICRVLMREQEDLRSKLIGYVPAQTSMVILEVPLSKNSRRLHVCEEHGVKGWVSTAKESGEQLLRRKTAMASEKALFGRLIQSGAAIDSAGTAAGKKNPSLTCDKCDGPHATDSCPFFKKTRDDHKDAWANYGEEKPPRMGSDGGNFVLRHARVVAQPPDGSCLFHSLKFGLREGFVASAEQLRRDIAQFIERHRNLEIAGDTIEEWVQWDQQISAEAYARRMAHAGWGGGLELACFSRMKRVNVHVYERLGAHFKRISCFDVPRPVQTVHVLYQGGVHYDALVPLT